MLVRTYRDSDLSQIAQLYYNTIHLVNSADYTEAQIEAWAPSVYSNAYWQERFQTYWVYVAEQEGMITGFAEFEPTGHIDCFYVHHQWQRQGVGSQLFRRIETEAQQLTLSKLFAEVSLTAQPFFLAKGFVVVLEQEKAYRNMLFQQFVMEKQLPGGQQLQSNADPEWIQRLETAIAGLQWSSESDYPFEIVQWADQSLEQLTIPQLLELTGHPHDTSVTMVAFDRFFHRATQPQDWHGPEEQATVRQYQNLLETLRTHLTDLRVYRVGQTALDIYIVGQTPADGVAGIATKAVET